MRTLVVDDQRAFRVAARRALRASSRFEVIAEASSAEEAFDLVAELHPDLIVMDVRLGGVDGITACRHLAKDVDHPEVVLVSTYRADDLPPDLRTCGACGFVSKVAFGVDALLQVLEAPAHEFTTVP